MCSPNVKAIATAEKTKKACELGMCCIAYVGGQVLANTCLIQKLGLECHKKIKVQTLGAVALHATTACTDDASTVGLNPLNCAIVYCPALSCML